MMEISVTRQHPVTVIALKGRLDVLTSKNLKDAVITEIDAGANHLVLDFTNLEYVSSAGLRVLLEARKILKPRDGSVVLSGVQSFITTILNSTGFDTLFAIHPDAPTAVGAISG
ncbi:anti-sigma factor antagonist [bacterium]|nr:anti-sigma factor antagonist [bacterium]